jgi:hypothetical protein
MIQVLIVFHLNFYEAIFYLELNFVFLDFFNLKSILIYLFNLIVILFNHYDAISNLKFLENGNYCI